MQTLVIGHKNPDMDAIVSAIGYAEFKKLSGEPDVEAARCGGTNERIDFVLRRFGFPAPAFVPDVSPRVGDVMETDVVSALEDEPLYDAVERIGEKRFRGLPVVARDGRCLGLISTFKITSYLFPPRSSVETSRVVNASLADICETLGGNPQVGTPSQEAMGHMMVVAAMQTDSFEKRISSMDRERIVLIVGDRINIQHIAIRSGIRALIVTGGLAISQETRELAEEHGTVILGSPHDTATTVLLARSATHAGEMLLPEFLSLRADMRLDEARSELAMSSQFAFPVLDENGNLQGILSKSDFLKEVPRRLILVDHNELSQAVRGAENVPIVEILDHHRIGSVHTDTPILFLNHPVGSTSTIVAMQYQQAGIALPKDVAGLLMAGLISDTLNLTSPTTTPIDHAIMKQLSKLCGVNPTDLAGQIFSVGSPLLTMGAAEAVGADMKEYEEQGVRFTISQIEELSFSHFDEKRADLLQALEERQKSGKLLFAALLVTDVNTQNSYLLVRGEESFVGLIDYPEVGNFIWRLDGVVSRKKQLLPYLSGLVAKRP
jgi:manganese-dependent inorganic pyrophosphatase